jgi:hypothetical protein
MIGFSGEIAKNIKQQNYSTKEGKDAAMATAKAMEKYSDSVSSAMKGFKEGNVDAEQLASIIKQADTGIKEFADSLEDTNPEVIKLKQELLQVVDTANELPKAFAKAKKELSEMKKGALGQLSQMPLGSEVAEVISSKGKAGLFALGAAGGALAMKYFGAETMARTQAEGDIARNRIDTEADVAKIRNEAEFIPQKITEERNKQRIESENEIARLNHEANFAAQKSAIQFSAQVASAGAEFRAASKTALFGNSLGSISYGASQMQMAGIGAEQVAEQLSAASSAMGTNITSQLASDMSVFAKRTGQSAESVAGMTDLFMRLDGSSAETALNMQEGLYALAKSADVDLGGMMKDIAEASKEALGYQIKSGPALAKQVAYSKSMGVNFNDIAKAGKGMVLNYKDSIKSEMQLSALLGRQVDLSEVRQKFASGDTQGALEALKAQGLDPAKMNMFQQQALTEATGMDLDTLNKIATRQGKTGELGAASAQKGNQKFLSATQSAQAGLAAAQASISAKTAVLDAELSQKIADGYLASDAYKKYQQDLAKQAEADRKLQGQIEDKWLNSDAYITAVAEASKVAIEQGFKEAIPMIMAGIAGGALTNFLGNRLMGKFLPKAGNFVKNLIPGFGKKAVTSTAANLTDDVARAGVKKFSQKQILAGFAGKEARDLALQQAGKTTVSTVANTGVKTAAGLTDDVAKAGLNLTDDVAKIGLQSAGKFGVKGVMSGLTKGLMKGGVTGVLGTATSMLGDYYGGTRKMEGIQEGDALKVHEGRAIQAGAQAIEYAGYGAALGSIIPGVGTVVGGAVGGLIGGIKGIWDGWFSDSAEAEDEALKQQEEQNKIIEMQKKQDEAAAASLAELEKQFGELGLAASDEGYFRSALLAQLVEATRLLDLSVYGNRVNEGGKISVLLDGVAVQRQLYNKAASLYSVVTPKPEKTK